MNPSGTETVIGKRFGQSFHFMAKFPFLEINFHRFFCSNASNLRDFPD